MSPRFRFVVNWLRLKSRRPPKYTCIVRSAAKILNPSGGFCAGLCTVVDHRRINHASFHFFAAALALIEISALEDIKILRNTPLILTPEHTAGERAPDLRSA